MLSFAPDSKTEKELLVLHEGMVEALGSLANLSGVEADYLHRQAFATMQSLSQSAERVLNCFKAYPETTAGG
ncbi:MAG: hypothetical protein HGA96_14380 [Desulfobulbaceae bacterium]|nr:hypothetical protein [Desulfobulbaceae bacterium]